MNEHAVVTLAIEFLRNRGYVVERKERLGLSQVEIIKALKKKGVNGKERDVYEAQGGSYFLTYTHEEHVISAATVEKMLAEKTLVPKWPENPKARCFVLR